MIAIVANFLILPGQSEAFEAAMDVLAQATRSNEPGVQLYQLCRSREDAQRYRLLELYDDQAALDHHMQTDWLKSTGRAIGPLLAERPVLEYLDPVG